MNAWWAAGAIVVAMAILLVVMGRSRARRSGVSKQPAAERASLEATPKAEFSETFAEDDTAPGVLTPPEWRGKNAA